MGEREGQDRERSTIRDSNSGRLKHNGAICQRADHVAISADFRWILTTLMKV